MKRARNCYIIIILFFVIIWVILPTIYKYEFNGNDYESILKVISLYEKENKKAIDIINITDIQEFRMVGYINNRTKGLGIIIFENLNSNYILKRIQNENKRNIILSSFDLFDKNENCFTYDVILSNNKNLKKIQRNINYKMIEEKMVDKSPCMIIWAIPQRVDNSEYSAQYLYFDKKDEIIEFNK